tara:strand:- start:7053 stop:7433 length:381 start_codon:yes stop_codon:yes gene_type:complete
MKNLTLIFFLLSLILISIFIPNSNQITRYEIIQSLTRQSARWATAAEQDDSDLIALLHANYGAGYLWALKDIATASEIKTATGVDVNRLTKEIISIQDKVTKRVIRKCPGFAPPKNYLSIVAGENI